MRTDGARRPAADFTDDGPTRPCQSILPCEEVLFAKRQYHSVMLRSTLMVLVEVCRADVELAPGCADAVEALLTWPDRDPRFDGPLRALVNYAENRTVIRGPELAYTLDAAEDLLATIERELETLEDPSLRVRLGAIAGEVARAARVVEDTRDVEAERTLARLRDGLAAGKNVFHVQSAHHPALDRACIVLSREGWQIQAKRYDAWIVLRFERREEITTLEVPSLLDPAPPPAPRPSS
ncbi:hypothetical protein L6R52_39940, partial [Myxococcota bacterium]|nr:hypothetical protein [Myxococcota bacterium]